MTATLAPVIVSYEHHARPSRRGIRHTWRVAGPRGAAVLFATEHTNGWSHALLGMHSTQPDPERPSLQLHDRVCPHIGGHRCWAKYSAALGTGLIATWVTKPRGNNYFGFALEQLYGELPPTTPERPAP